MTEQSSVVKILEPDNFAVSSSTVGITNLSLRTFLFNFFRSTQRRTWLFFKTGTIGAHHSVGSVELL